VIRAQDGELEAVYPQHEAAVLAVAVEPGGRLAVSSGRDNRLHAWSLADAKQVRKQEGVTSEVARLLSTPEGWLAGGSDRKVWLLAPGLAKGAVELGAHQEWIAALAWSAEAGLAASGSLDGEVRIWNLKERREIGRFRAQP